jgi:hypothetical protein
MEALAWKMNLTIVLTILLAGFTTLKGAGHKLMETSKNKLYLTISLASDRIGLNTEIICRNRNNEKGLKTCLLAIRKKCPLQ